MDAKKRFEIEELARALCNLGYKTCDVCKRPACHVMGYAENAYKAGLRKVYDEKEEEVIENESK